MFSPATTAEQYLNELPADRKEPVRLLRDIVLKNLPKGFKETMGYGMLNYVVPHSLYPAGYHCNPKQPLPFACIAVTSTMLNKSGVKPGQGWSYIVNTPPSKYLFTS